MKILVCLSSAYVREQQIYVGQCLDTAFDEKEENNWLDVSMGVAVAILDAKSVQKAIEVIAKEYNCSADRFDGYVLDENEAQGFLR